MGRLGLFRLENVPRVHQEESDQGKRRYTQCGEQRSKPGRDRRGCSPVGEDRHDNEKDRKKESPDMKMDSHGVTVLTPCGRAGSACEEMNVRARPGAPPRRMADENTAGVNVV